MNRIHLLFTRQSNDAVHVKVGLHGAQVFPHKVRLVGLEPVQAQPVFLGINGDSTQSEFGGGAHNADGDFTAVQRE